jgi:hypothetical protein
LRRFNSPNNVRERSRQPLPIWAPQTRTHASVCEGMRASQGAGSTAAAAFAIPDATPESTPTQHSPAPAAAPRGADDATPCHRPLPISEHVCARCAQQPTDGPTRRTRKRTRRRTRRRTQVPYMKTVSRSVSSSVGFILRGRRPFRKRRCRSKREREPCRTCAARARGFESKTAIAIVVVYSVLRTYRTYSTFACARTSFVPVLAQNEKERYWEWLGIGQLPISEFASFAPS